MAARERTRTYTPAARSVGKESTRPTSYRQLYDHMAETFKDLHATAEDRTHHMLHYLRIISIRGAEVGHDAGWHVGQLSADHGHGGVLSKS